ncbi:MAG: hypothetical protein P1U46_02450 [Patescibacteria group bacterium]|nr:hypothetical protein [Patescibacteria group bacterium]
MLTLLMFFINILSVLEDISYKLINSINSKLTISLYLNEDYDKTSLEVTDLINDINDYSKTIKVEYKNKDEILDEIRLKEPSLVQILEKNNPLPDTIVLSELQLKDYETINSIIEQKLFLLINDNSTNDYFANYTTQYKKIASVISVLDVLKM